MSEGTVSHKQKAEWPGRDHELLGRMAETMQKVKTEMLTKMSNNPWHKERRTDVDDVIYLA